MSRPIVILRPEPGATATVAAIRDAGHQAVAIPLFQICAVAWLPPEPDQHDALFLTSANAARSAGDGLARLHDLPVFAVGDATAAAAREAGLNVVETGRMGARDLVDKADARGIKRGLLLCGRDHLLKTGGPVSRAIIVYASDPLPIGRARLGSVEGAVATLHSQRAAARFAELVDQFDLARGNIRIAALSASVSDAAGPGWATNAIASHPTDDALLRAAVRLAD